MSTNQLSFFCYILPPVSSLYALSAHRHDALVRFHARQSLLLVGFYITGLILLEFLAAGFGLLNKYLGILIDVVKYVAIIGVFLIWLRCLMESLKGNAWPIPLVGMKPDEVPHHHD